jgi:hypothetical protein
MKNMETASFVSLSNLRLLSRGVRPSLTLPKQLNWEEKLQVFRGLLVLYNAGWIGNLNKSNHLRVERFQQFGDCYKQPSAELYCNKDNYIPGGSSMLTVAFPRNRLVHLPRVFDGQREDN